MTNEDNPNDEPTYLCVGPCKGTYCKDEVAYLIRSCECMCEGCHGSDDPNLGKTEDNDQPRRYEDVI